MYACLGQTINSLHHFPLPASGHAKWLHGCGSAVNRDIERFFVKNRCVVGAQVEKDFCRDVIHSANEHLRREVKRVKKVQKKPKKKVLSATRRVVLVTMLIANAPLSKAEVIRLTGVLEKVITSPFKPPASTTRVFRDLKNEGLLMEARRQFELTAEGRMMAEAATEVESLESVRDMIGKHGLTQGLLLFEEQFILPFQTPSQVIEYKCLDPADVCGERLRSRMVMVIDGRETKGALTEGVLRKHLAGEPTVTVETAVLTVGDVAWKLVVEHEGAVLEYFSGVVLERKQIADLSASVMDGRYQDQKYRLLSCVGIQAVIYLIEGDMRCATGMRVGPEQCEQATVTTQFVSGFNVIRTRDIHESAQFLFRFHRQLLTSDHSGLVPWMEWLRAGEKTKLDSVSEALAKMLRTVNGVKVEGAEALVSMYPTPALLRAALLSGALTEASLKTHWAQVRGAKRKPVSQQTLDTLKLMFA
ncbi:MAG: hypothetical protein KVP17_000402 [Porospora cf. gigantea B]|uniref:uncharacterized protein n=1 Tax=Porospora cf. gigantea B TaxID=2853592 RepID=UPI003571DA28|nr:MAG: hypothetical protein KVP17_000402 [Porospora cf. gigantea B]